MPEKRVYISQEDMTKVMKFVNHYLTQHQDEQIQEGYVSTTYLEQWDDDFDCIDDWAEQQTIIDGVIEWMVTTKGLLGATTPPDYVTSRRFLTIVQPATGQMRNKEEVDEGR